jgi:hypothetical protein
MVTVMSPIVADAVATATGAFGPLGPCACDIWFALL